MAETKKKNASNDEKQDWHKDQIRKFKRERQAYQAMAQTLEEILKCEARQRAPMAFVQARAKALSSFAEKALRKYNKYRDPVHQLTDLCGARVITLTQPQAAAMCDFIRRNFIVDEANSLDTTQRLATTEFGYRSVHYVIQMKPGELSGVRIPQELFPDGAAVSPYKAEIQVRTLLQHAWADLVHDRVYKNEMKVPAPIERESARLAALLETAESAFARFVDGVDSYIVHYGAYMDGDRLKNEIGMLAVIRDGEEDEETRMALTLRIAKLAKAAGDWERIIKELKPYAKGTHPVALRELGNAICQIPRYRQAPAGSAYQRGQRLMERAIKLDGSDAVAHAMLAESWQRVVDEEEQALSLYRKAYELAPSNPYHLAAFLEYEIKVTNSGSSLSALAPALREAIRQCEAHATVGIELPWAYFTIGKLRMLLGETYESINAYLKALRICAAQDSSVCEEAFDAELASLKRLSSARNALLGSEWEREFLLEAVRRILLLGKSIRFHPQAPLEKLRKCATPNLSYKRFRRAAILSGGCDARVEAQMRTYEACLKRAFADFEGAALGGGTRAGISGILGSITQSLKGKRKFESFGYHPLKKDDRIRSDTRYNHLTKTIGQDFSPLDAIQGWVDLVASGLMPSHIRVVGINGGRIAAIEYRLALALGAEVCVLKDSGRSAEEILKDPFWSDHPHLVALPVDSMAIAAFLNAQNTPLDDESLEKAARHIHESFCAGRKPGDSDETLRPWETLAEKFKTANRDQASYAGEVLRQVGFGVRKRDRQAIRLPSFSKEQIQRMAEMEHGRWLVERIKSGWTYGPKRDNEKKQRPSIVPWEQLPQEEKDKDVEAVRSWPQIFKAIGSEIYPLGKAATEEAR